MDATSHDEAEGVACSRRKPLTLRDRLLWGAVVVVCGLLAVRLALPAIRFAPQAGRYARCRNKLLGDHAGDAPSR